MSLVSLSARGETVGPFGVSTSRDPFDDGLFDGVGTVKVYTDNLGVSGIKIQYVTKEKFHLREHESFGISKDDFKLEYPEEFITVIKETQSFDMTYNTSFVSSIGFTTSYGRTSDLFGSSALDGIYFALNTEGHVEKFIGFLGSSSVRINTLEAHFGTRTPTFESKPNSECGLPVGGVSTLSFDDGVFDGVSKLTLRENTSCIACRIHGII
ncbi:myrosinase-binding protein 2-like [Raphanus sativus]|uniref:Myrosinase-binding protein 2-like n=1 Tax=Raphanus sativus TaxID=3726 RepID=A0A6J0KK34_RAPSA|nr:myrosinase-binding protein 2-like [Raphanus sativus]